MGVNSYTGTPPAHVDAILTNDLVSSCFGEKVTSAIDRILEAKRKNFRVRKSRSIARDSRPSRLRSLSLGLAYEVRGMLQTFISYDNATPGRLTGISRSVSRCVW